MSAENDIFLERYNNLNERQKEAVDTIYGPVMVIAGPGTGKTEVLSMRIANLLRSDIQVQPGEILCLTYTDEATNSMRRRLLQIIGTAAHKINICTFHAFCNNVIQSHSDYFSLRSLQPITELERTELLYELLEQLPQGHVLRKLSGNIYYDADRLNKLFDFMKRENYRPEDISSAVVSYLNDLPNREQYIYKRAGKGFQKGDLKQALIDEEEKKMSMTRAAAELFETYTERMKSKGRYDFTDMLVWVLEAFKSHPALLQTYQERHQFILVDEFQDTNGAQSELLNLLTSYWEDPNIFVVGDDDQSIYEFQGARIHNIIDFYRRYQENIHIIVLPHNYRSSQPILDKASAAIQNNQQRLIHQLQELNLDKNIVAAASRFLDHTNNIQPIVKTYSNILHEEADIILQIEELQRQGVRLNEIAVLYAQHKQADNIIALMERKGIPYSVKKPVNILELPLVEQIINVLKYLDAEIKLPYSGEIILFELIHSPYYQVDPTDIAMLSLYIDANKNKDRSLGYWRLLLGNDLLLESLNLNTSVALRRLGHNIDNWLRAQATLPLPLLVEKIIYESGIVSHLLSGKDYTWNIQVLNSFFEYVKECHDRNARIKISDFLGMIERMLSENIAIPVQKIIQNENGVQFYTAHGAKGNEFEHVFLIGCTKKFWEDKRGGGNEYKLPDTITKTDEDGDKTYKAEVARRLFYVALTRAKKHLQISYAVADNLGKPLEHSIFIDEISTTEERIDHSVATPDLINHIQWAMTPVQDVRIKLANYQWIERVLQSFTMSVTSLSKYLRCPLSFYYENILKVPFLKNDALAFGSAVHNTLERFFLAMKKTNEFPTKEEMLNMFMAFLRMESESFTSLQYDRRKEQGQNVLSDYYDQYINKWTKNVEVEFRVPRYHLDGVPVTGKIDKMEFDGGNCTVIDYKSGDPDRSAKTYTAAPNEAEPLGGDYWRQMVFYKLLIENFQERNWKVNMGMFDYIEKGKQTNQYKQVYIPMYDQDEQVVRKQLKDTYARIMNHDFDTGCGKDDCYWCNFTRKYELVRPGEKEMIEMDDA